MNYLSSIIKKRRSIRKYKDKHVSDKLIKEVIDAARLAPSGCNAQPTYYYVVRSADVKSKLKKNRVFAQEFVYSAPIIIVCCGDPSAYPREEDKVNSQSYKYRAERDVAIASQNLVLQATDLGLGTCYIGWVDRKKIARFLNIGKRFVIPLVITLGYPAEKPKTRPRKKLEEIMKIL